MLQIEQYALKGYGQAESSKVEMIEFYRRLRQHVELKTHLPLRMPPVVISGLMTALFIISVFALVTAVVGATTIYVPSEGIQTIQQAVDSVVEGDEIIVRAAYTETGTRENIDIEVPHLTIRSENNSVTVIAANPYDHVFHVKANYTTITGFTVTGTDVSEKNYSAGIYLDRVHHCDISNNKVTANFYGIYLYASSDNVIGGNNASVNKNYGIYLVSASANTIFGNAAHSNNNPGIYLYASNANTISGNSADSNRNAGISLYSSTGNTFSGNSANLNTIYGISLYSSHSNSFSSNTITGNENSGIALFSSNENSFAANSADSNKNYGIYLARSSRNTFSDTTATGNENTGISFSSSHENNFSNGIVNLNANWGIYLDASNSNTIARNSINSNELSGIYLESSGNTMISENIASHNSEGIYLYYSNSNTISGNNASNNLFGIYIDSSSSNIISGNRVHSNTQYGILIEASGNTIYNNYFENNKNAGGSGSNTWNVSKAPGLNIVGGPYTGGNYWSDYVGIDTDHDGLGDTLVPYPIGSGGDWLPLLRDTTPLVRDTTPPAITNRSAMGITTDSATITWDTDEPSDSLVQYGTESGSLLLTASDATFATSHSVTLTGLSPGTTYYYVVKSTDHNGNTAASSEDRFTTVAAQTSIPVKVVIKPKTVNLNWWNRRVFAFITLPDDYKAADVDIHTIKCGGAPAVKGWVGQHANKKYIVAIFARKDLLGVTPGSRVRLTVTGTLKDGTLFEGSDTVRVIGRGERTGGESTNVVIKPETLNLRSRGLVTALIMLPEGYKAANINLSTVVCEGAPAVKGWVVHQNKYIAVFETEAFGELDSGSEVELTVSGNLEDGTPFEATDTIRVIEKDLRRR